ncbi:MAG: DNA gyrase/topoisomerase IV subunit A, partial [Bacteroidetes bacterium]|nr:DNA gyrase/topoisomerase IV subunit A [Bacteroidota bacterium]
LTEYAIDYFKQLKKDFGQGRERKTEIRAFDTIEATKVVVANRKLYVNKEEGFVGYGLKKDEYISDCSDIDDIIIFRKDGVVMVTKVDAKKFVGKDILHAAVWKKGDDRTVYHMVYQDGSAGPAYVKRFNVTGVTRDKEYDLTSGKKGSRVLYFSANPNGESEVITLKLRPRPKLKNLRLDFDMTELAIKGRGSKGNILTKNLVSKIELKEKGESTLSARNVWIDEVTRRLNVDGRGRSLGQFGGEDKLLLISDQGFYRLVSADLALHFNDDISIIEKWHPDRPISIVYFDGVKERYTVKRFLAEASTKDVLFITDHDNSQLLIATTAKDPVVKVEYDQRSSAKEDEEISLESAIDVKGVSAIGNRFIQDKPKNMFLLESEEEDEEIEEVPTDDPEDGNPGSAGIKGGQTVKKDTRKGLSLDQTSEKPLEVDFDIDPLPAKPAPKPARAKKKKDPSSDDEGQISLF